MVLHGGLDLHGDNVYCTVMDEEYRPIYERRLPNDLATVLAALEPDWFAGPGFPCSGVMDEM